MRVVVVDDSKSVRMKITRMLTQLGHEVVGEGQDGLEALHQCNEKKPDLVTLDIVMPKMDGITALRALKGMCPNTKTVIISSAASLDNKIKMRALGVDAFLTKPITLESFEKCLNGIFESNKAA